MKKITSKELTNLIYGSRNDRLMVAWNGLLYKYLNLFPDLTGKLPETVDEIIDFIIDHHKTLRIFDYTSLTVFHEINLWDYKGEPIPWFSRGLVEVYAA